MRLPTGTTGAIQELRVAADLLIRGYAVFRSLSPACSCDLAVIKDKKLIRIEVASAYILKTGKAYFAKHNKDLYDIMALVFKDGRIEYRPDI